MRLLLRGGLAAPTLWHTVMREPQRDAFGHRRTRRRRVERLAHGRKRCLGHTVTIAREAVQSVERAAAILRILAAEREPLPLGEIADALDLAKATAHGILRTLRGRGLRRAGPDTGPLPVRLGLRPSRPDAGPQRAALARHELGGRAGRAHRPGGRGSAPSTGPRGRRRTTSSGPTARHPALLASDELRRARHRPGQGAARARPRRATRCRPGASARRYTHRTVTDLARRCCGQLADARDTGWAGLVGEAPAGPGRARRADPRPRGSWSARRRRGPRDRVCDAPARPRAGDSSSRSIGAARLDLARARSRRRRMTERYVAAIDQGTTSSRCIVFDRDGPEVVAWPSASTTRTSRARLGRARRRGDLGQRPAGRAARRCADAGARAAEVAARRHHQPARDHGGLGPAPPAGRSAQRDRLAGHPHRQLAAPSSPRDGRTRLSQERTGLPLATYFSGAEAALAARRRRRAARARRARRGAVRHDGQLADLEPDRRSGGVHVTDVTNASRTMLMNLETLRLGPASCSTLLRHAARDAAGDPASIGEVYGTARSCVAGHAGRRRRSATSRPRCSGRPASTPARRSAPTAPAASCC